MIACMTATLQEKQFFKLVLKDTFFSLHQGLACSNLQWLFNVESNACIKKSLDKGVGPVHSICPCKCMSRVSSIVHVH